jgi:hypothetical protein
MPLTHNGNPIGFKKGQSGNPAGLSKMHREVMRYARGYSIEAIDKLVEIMRGRSRSLAKKAADSILDRGLGRPPQSKWRGAGADRISRQVARPGDEAGCA